MRSIALVLGAGIAFCVPAFAEAVSKTGSKFVSPAIRQFLALRKQELGERFQADAMLLISFESLGERVNAWDGYLSRFRGSPLKQDAEYYNHTYLNAFLLGLANTPVFRRAENIGDEEVYVMPEETRKVYVDFVREHPRSRSGKIVAEYYAIVERNGFRQTDEAEKFVSAQGISSSIAGMQLLR